MNSLTFAVAQRERTEADVVLGAAELALEALLDLAVQHAADQAAPRTERRLQLPLHLSSALQPVGSDTAALGLTLRYSCAEVCVGTAGAAIPCALPLQLPEHTRLRLSVQRAVALRAAAADGGGGGGGGSGTALLGPEAGTVYVRCYLLVAGVAVAGPVRSPKAHFEEGGSPHGSWDLGGWATTLALDVTPELLDCARHSPAVAVFEVSAPPGSSLANCSLSLEGQSPHELIRPLDSFPTAHDLHGHACRSGLRSHMGASQVATARYCLERPTCRSCKCWARAAARAARSRFAAVATAAWRAGRGSWSCLLAWSRTRRCTTCCRRCLPPRPHLRPRPPPPWASAHRRGGSACPQAVACPAAATGSGAARSASV